MCVMSIHAQYYVKRYASFTTDQGRCCTSFFLSLSLLLSHQQLIECTWILARMRASLRCVAFVDRPESDTITHSDFVMNECGLGGNASFTRARGAWNNAGRRRRGISLSLYCKSKIQFTSIQLNKYEYRIGLFFYQYQYIYIYVYSMSVGLVHLLRTHTRTLNNIHRSQKRDKERKRR